MSAPARPLTVSGPAVPETVRILRAVAAAVGARAGFRVDRIDELRIAIDEAATLVLRAGGAGVIEMSIDTGQGVIRTEIRSDGPAAGWPGERGGSWAWRVIDTVATDAEMTSDEGHPVVRFALGTDEERG
jgi:serine/threonine-protein kinase RsbW